MKEELNRDEDKVEALVKKYGEVDYLNDYDKDYPLSNYHPIFTNNKLYRKRKL